MFSVLGARLLIEEVHARSRAAALVGSVLRRARGRPAHGSSASLDSSSEASGGAGTSYAHRRTASAASTSSLGSGAEGWEIEEAGGSCDGGAASRLRRCGSAWSSASTASIAAFASGPDHEAGGSGDGSTGAGLVPMAPPGRILWLLPDARDPSARPQLVETDQSSFRRFLFTLDTTHHHLPDTYSAVLASLVA